MYPTYQGPHGEVLGGEKEGTQTWGSDLIGVMGEGPRVSPVHSLLTNLKYKSRN